MIKTKKNNLYPLEQSHAFLQQHAIVAYWVLSIGYICMPCLLRNLANGLEHYMFLVIFFIIFAAFTKLNYFAFLSNFLSTCLIIDSLL